MPHSKLVQHAYEVYNRYYADFDNISNPNIRAVLNSAVSRYHYFLGNGLDYYGKPEARYIDFYNQSPSGFKKLIKYACYLDRNSDAPDFAEKLTDLAAMADDFIHARLAEVADSYDLIFSDSDFAAAKEYFTANPDAVYAGSADGLMYSYIKSEDKITRRSTNLGFGGFGRTRVGVTEHNDRQILAIKRQSKKSYHHWPEEKKVNYAIRLLEDYRAELNNQTAAGDTDSPLVKHLKATLERFTDANTQFEEILEELDWLSKAQREAYINFDLQVATAGLVVRRNPDGSIYKVYQEMHNIGPSLDNYLQDTYLSDIERWELMVKLLVLGDDLHSGNLSRTGTAYAHRDIKSQNILVDANGDLYFIDFGFTVAHNLFLPHIACEGTPEFLPISFDPMHRYDAYKALQSLQVRETPSYLFDDKVAILRTIYHQVYGTGILSRGMFQSLPKHIVKLICSHDIEYLKRVDATHTCKFLAAALISYSVQPEYCTEEFLDSLAKYPDIQEQVINDYTQTRQKTRGLDLATIKQMLLGREVYFEYLPYAYRIRSSMEPSYLQFILENNLLPDVDMDNLTQRLNVIIGNSGFDPSLVRAVLNNQKFLIYYLQRTSNDDLELFFDTINAYNMLSDSELTDVHVRCLGLNRIVPAIQEVADFNQIFYKLASNALLTSEVSDTTILERLCDILAYNDNEIDFKPELAIEILQQAHIFKSSASTVEQPEAVNVDKFIANFMLVAEQCVKALEACPTAQNTQQYVNTKVFFAVTIRLHILVNQLESGVLDEEGFAREVELLAAFYQPQVFINEPLKKLFYPDDRDIQVSPISVADLGIFNSSETTKGSDIDCDKDLNKPLSS